MAHSGTTHPAAQRWQRYLDFHAWAPSASINPVWLGGGGRFLFTRPRQPEQLLLADPAAGTVTDAAEITPEEARSDGFVVEGPHAIRLGRMRRIDLIDGATSTIPLAEQEALERAAPRLIRPPLMDGYAAFWEIPSPDGEWMLTENGHDLALRCLRDDRTQPLTVTGESDWAWTVAGATWAPDGRQIFARRTDWRQRPGVSIMHYLKDIEEVEVVHPYAKTHTPPAPIDYMLIDAPSGKTTPVLTDLEPGARVAVLGWRGHELYLHVFDLAATWEHLYAIDRRTGTARVVLESPLSLSGAMSYRRAWARAAAFHLSRESETFLWPSDRDGWNHWYRYTTSGELLGQVTGGDWDDEEIVAVDGADGAIFYTAHPDPHRPFDTHLCAVDRDGAAWRRLTSASADHRISASPDGRYFIDTYSTVSLPPRTVVLDGTGAELLEVAAVRDGDLPEQWAAPLEVTAQAADGVTELHGVLYLPPGFDPQARYPLVDVIYGGPQIQIRPTTFDQTAFSGSEDGEPILRGEQAQALAQLGFVTLVIDGRGTPGRGRDFHEVVRHRMGQHEIPDHAAVIRQLTQQYPWLDPGRVGIVGRSWGGYLTLRAMLTAPDVFAVGCADAPVPDHLDHQAHLAYMIMDLPENNPDGYRDGSCLPIADRLEGKLLITHGTSDLGATFSATMKMADAFIKTGRPFDLVVLPEGTHHPTGQRLRYLNGRIARYLVEHLHPAGITPDDIPLAE